MEKAILKGSGQGTCGKAESHEKGGDWDRNLRGQHLIQPVALCVAT